MNFERDEYAAGVQDAGRFAERAVMSLFGWEMMQHQYGDHGGKLAGGERQTRGISSDDSRSGTIVLRQLCREARAVFQAGDATRAAMQLRGGSSRASTDFQYMIAECDAVQ